MAENFLENLIPGAAGKKKKEELEAQHAAEEAAKKPSAADIAKEKQEEAAEKRSQDAALAQAVTKAEAKLAADKAAKLPKLAVDGNWGAATTAAIQTVLGHPVGGDWINNADATALQQKLGITADGLFGTNSNKALQTYLGVTADGVFGPNSVKALQERLNAGTFFA